MSQKSKTVFVCEVCGHESPKWFGQCPACHEWNSAREIEKKTSRTRQEHKQISTEGFVDIAQVPEQSTLRFASVFSQLDRVLGGGIVPGSVVLLGGDPGVGKSTLLTQVCTGYPYSFYFSGEESPAQIRLRVQRLRQENVGTFKVLTSGYLDEALSLLTNHHAEEIGSGKALLVVDSIQTMQTSRVSSLPGGAVQIRECASELVAFAKQTQVPVMIVAHVTKSGLIAGPKLIEHLVDVVLYFEGERDTDLRILRGMKNRFGPTNEIGIFEMAEQGLAQVDDPSERFYDRESGLSGNALGVVLEGSTPLVVEVQGLVVKTEYSTPRRLSKGIDPERLALISAVLTKRLGFPVDGHDMYLNLLGGLKVKDPGVEFPLAVSLFSSFTDIPAPHLSAFFGEVGLDGKIRPVSYPEKRIMELQRLGFQQAFVPAGTKKRLSKAPTLRVFEFSLLSEALRFFTQNS
ncbi:MAG TPA: DNA repair protein RadA [Thermotogota bacterium]|nr:DNA repair protein RadA [Thermotogota bacterium]HRW92014.1 DNA repair protein RadA [Thermotogota bacterium]